MSPQPQKPSPSQDRHTYIPEHVQQAMTKQVEQMMPAHMKQYAGAYVQQNMVTPGQAMSSSGRVSGPPPGYKPVNHLPRPDHFHQYKPQTPSKADSFVMSEQAAPQQAQPNTDTYQQPAPQTTQNPNYDFFMNPEQHQAPKRGLPGGNSLLTKVLFVSGGLLMLIVVLSLVKSVFGGSSNTPYFLSVAQDQQELIHITSDALTQQDISTGNKNFAATAQLSLGTSQSDIVSLLASSGTKFSTSQLGLKVSAKTDQQLAAAVSGGTFNETFKEVCLSQLQTYVANMNTAYNHSKSAKGRALLHQQYLQAQLLVTQLNSADSVASN